MNPQVFKQAQSRGWMEGWRMQGIQHTPKAFNVYMKSDTDIQVVSLNDILFGTDFCEKFFIKSIPTEIGYCSIGSCFIGLQNHKSWLAMLSEQERIEFLEKHLEEREKTPKDIQEAQNYCFDTHEHHHRISMPHIHLDGKKPKPIKKIPPTKTQPKEIEILKLYKQTGFATTMEVTSFDVGEKLNDVIDAVNQIRKDLDKTMYQL